VAAKLTADKAQQLLLERFQAAMAKVTPESIAGNHTWQIAVLTCVIQNILCMCSRRAGKSELACGLLLLTAAATADTSNLYLGLTKESAGIVWRKFKKLLRKLKLFAMCQVLEAEQLCVLPNGSRILFTGTDDTRRITHLLGDQLSNGIAIIDESQDDPGIMQRTVEDILGPMLDETTADKPIPGRLVLLGTVPDVPAGYFWQTWVENTGSDDVGQSPYQHQSENWALFCWSRFDNPFQVDNLKRLHSYCKKYKYDVTDPEIRRRWYGERCFSADANAYRFVAVKHTYTPTVTERVELGPFHCLYAPNDLGADRFIVGIDQAQRRDRFAIVCWAWNHLIKDKLWQMAEAVTDPGADPQDSDWLAVCAELKRRYGPSIEYIRDAGGSSAPVNDALKLSHGIIVVSAIKGPGSLKARVQRLSDLLARGVARVIEGSELSGDLLTAKWSLQAREKGKWELDKTAKSPDIADAATYALDLPSYTTRGAQPTKPKPKTEGEWLREQQQKTLQELVQGKKSWQRREKPNTALVMWQPPPRNN